MEFNINNLLYSRILMYLRYIYTLLQNKVCISRSHVPVGLFLHKYLVYNIHNSFTTYLLKTYLHLKIELNKVFTKCSLSIVLLLLELVKKCSMLYVKCNNYTLVELDLVYDNLYWCPDQFFLPCKWGPLFTLRVVYLHPQYTN